MKLTPHSARMYLLLGVFLLALPAIGKVYGGHTGKLLVASPNLRGPYFRETVILLGHHSWGHAYGVVVNRPFLGKRGEKGIGADKGSETEVSFYYGGPVEAGQRVFVLERLEKGVRWLRRGGLPDDMSDARFWVFYGYSGWGPLQLNREITKGQWDIIDYDPALVFETLPDEIWPEARRRVLLAKKVKKEGVI